MAIELRLVEWITTEIADRAHEAGYWSLMLSSRSPEELHQPAGKADILTDAGGLRLSGFHEPVGSVALWAFARMVVGVAHCLRLPREDCSYAGSWFSRAREKANLVVRTESGRLSVGVVRRSL